ncbi:MAG: hydrogenase expression/formation protein HypE [Phycisphaerales bacterium]|jgi:hydrogenase expression/formation protein HypE|nr:hydrogenase expression/formation protein HypE [Phycisphaerales bacterium]
MSGPSPANLLRKRVVLAHGGGGQLTDDLVSELVAPRFANPYLDTLDDAARIPMHGGEMLFTTDSYVVHPLQFPGGDIGRLAISGTVNDLAVCGAIPQFVSLGLIIEEGLELRVLEQILESIASTAREAGVRVVTGDTKVVGKGQGDGLYINTAGVGAMRPGVQLGMARVRPGDVLIVSGPIAEHGLAIMLTREQPNVVRSELASDVAPLGGLIEAALRAGGESVVFMRDPTRGGFAGVASDLASRTGLRLTIDEEAIPIRPATRYAAEILGLDPLSVANEGKVMLVVRPGAMEVVLRALREHPLGKDAAAMGRFERFDDGLCEIVTRVGGRRIIQKPYGEELPRIC